MMDGTKNVYRPETEGSGGKRGARSWRRGETLFPANNKQRMGRDLGDAKAREKTAKNSTNVTRGTKKEKKKAAIIKAVIIRV